tara:strand:+ start:5865 stop:6647 length:783 start_codon:yes stop_codon:yes gene_type:complete
MPIKNLFIFVCGIFSLLIFTSCGNAEVNVVPTTEVNESNNVVNINQAPGIAKGKPPDRYACVINSAGHCIFTGSPHQTGLKPGTNNIIDRAGNVLFSINAAVASNATGELLMPSGRPAFDGDEMIMFNTNDMDADEKAFHRTMAIMFPIRNMLMYDIETATSNEWNNLVEELTKRDIKQITYTGGPTPKDNFYSTEGIFKLAKQPNNRDIHHDVMKFLEESGLYLLCHVTSDAFNAFLQESHPEGHDPCQDANISSKIGY